MANIIQCPNCAKRYQVADGILGSSVRCQQCGNSFTATLEQKPTPEAIHNPLDSLTDAELSQSSGTPAFGSPRRHTNSLSTPSARAKSSSVSNPSGGPTDSKMRRGACGMLGIGVLLIVVCIGQAATTGSVFMLPVALIPVMLVLGTTALISPNVVRSIGKFGGHLPTYYKVIGWGVMSSSMLLIIPVMIWLFASGYRTDTPGARARVRRARSASSAVAPPMSRRKNAAAQKNSTVKPRKAYPVSIAVPNHSVVVPANFKLKSGTPLEACWSDTWNPITTLSENSDGSVNVRWDDFGKNFDCSMVRSELIIRKDVLDPSKRVQPTTQPSPAAPPPATTPLVKANRNTTTQPKANTAPKPFKAYPVTIGVPSDSQFVPSDAGLQSGTKLQACWAGKWNPITFLSTNNDGTLTVRWDDFGPSYDCRMARNELIIKKETLNE